MQSGLEAAALLEPDDHERRTETVDSEALELRGLVGKSERRQHHGGGHSGQRH